MSTLPVISTQDLIIGAIAAVLLCPVVYRIAQRRFDPFEPLVIFAFAWALMFVVRPATMLVDRNVLLASWPSNVVDLSSTFTPALLLGLLGAAGFVVGYALPIGRRLGQRRSRHSGPFSTEVAVTWALVAAGIGTLLFLGFFLANGGLAGLSTLLAGRSAALKNGADSASLYFWEGPNLVIPAALVLLVLGRSRRSAAIFLAGVLASGVVLLRALPTGQRIMLIPFVGGLVVYWYVSRGRRPRIVTAVFLLFLALVLSAVIGETRTANPYGPKPSFAANFGETLIHPGSAFARITKGGDGGEFPALAAALQIVPSKMPYTYGRSILGDLATRGIPRKLWSAKPLPPREQIISALWPREYLLHQANPEFTAALMFYLDFGSLGVLVGLLIYGVVARALWEYFSANRQDMGTQLLFAVGTMLMISGARDGIVDTAILGSMVVLPIWLIFRAAASSSHARPMTSAMTVEAGGDSRASVRVAASHRGR